MAADRQTYGQSGLALRSKWLFTPGDATRVTFIADYNKRHSWIGDNRAVLPGSVSLGGYTSLPGFQDIQGPWPSASKFEQGGASLKVQQSLKPFDLMNLVSYRKLTGEESFDNVGIPLPVIDVLADLRVKTFTEELQLLSNSSSSFKWIAGAFFMHDQNGYLPFYGLHLQGIAFPAPLSGENLIYGINTSLASVFSEATFNIWDQTHMTLGARYIHDTKALVGGTELLGTGGALLETIPAPAGTRVTYQKPTWRFGLDHELTADSLVYFSYNRGFRSGSFNTVSGNPTPVQRESVDAFEIGSKNEFFNHRLRVNAAAFYSIYTNMQITLAEGATQDVVNAGKAHMKGLEIETSAAVTQQLSVNLGLAFLDARFVQFGPSPCTERNGAGMTVGTTCNPAGNYIPRAPKFTANLGPNYTIPTPIGSIGTTLNYFWSGKFYWEPDNRLTQDGYGVLNGTLFWTSINTHYTVRAYGRNLTNKEYSVFDVAQAGLNDQYVPAPPRTYGVEFEVKF